MRRFIVLCFIAAATAAQAEPWNVAPRPHGVVKFKVEGPLDDVVGESRTIAGNLELDTANWAAGHGVVAVDLSLLRTGIDERDRDMRVEFLQTQRYPFAIMTIDKLERLSSPALDVGKSAEGEAVGSFEVHGIRRAVRVPLKAKLGEDKRLTISGSFEVPFADYNVQRPQRLFLKLGDTAEVTFEVVFETKPKEAAKTAAAPGAVKPPEAPTVTNILAPSAKSKPRPPRKPKPAIVVTTTLFSGDDAKAKGEKLFNSVEAGGFGNKLTCSACHAKADERQGLRQADGYARAGHTLYNAGQRSKFWNGFAPTVGKASNICQKMFMKGDGMTDEQLKQLTAFIEAISPDPAPDLDYATLYRTYDSALRDPIGGDPVKGKAIADVYCMTCHLDGRMAPTWAPGLYEPDWLVRRVRHLEGHADRQMPAFSIERLPDSDLRDIVTYLTSPKVAPPIFDRKKTATAPASSGAKAGQP